MKQISKGLQWLQVQLAVAAGRFGWAVGAVDSGYIGQLVVQGCLGAIGNPSQRCWLGLPVELGFGGLGFGSDTQKKISRIFLEYFQYFVHAVVSSFESISFFCLQSQQLSTILNVVGGVFLSLSHSHSSHSTSSFTSLIPFLIQLCIC